MYKQKPKMILNPSDHKNYLLAKIYAKQNRKISLTNEGLIDIKEMDFSGFNLHQIHELSSQDKHLYILSKMKKGLVSLEEVKNSCQDKCLIHKNRGDSTYRYYSDKEDWSWFYILKYELHEQLILSNNDYAIQMRQSSPFSKFLNQEEFLYFFNKWRPILISVSSYSK